MAKKKTTIRFLKKYGANQIGEIAELTTAQQIQTAQLLADGGICEIYNPTIASTTPAKRIEAGKIQTAAKEAQADAEAKAAAQVKADADAKEKETSATFQKQVEAEQSELSAQIEEAKPKRRKKRPTPAE